MSPEITLLKPAWKEGVHFVEMAEMRVSTSLTENIVAYGLGACVAVCMYDASMKIAGVAHVVAPSQKQFTAGAAGRVASASPGKFADSAIPLLIDEICRAGGKRTSLRCAIAGGSRIFGALTNDLGVPSGLEIGERTVAAVNEVLMGQEVQVRAADVGGNFGRTVLIRVCDGAVFVKQIGGQSNLLSILSRTSDEVAA